MLGSAREILVPAKVIGKGRYSDRLLAAIDHALEFAEKDRPQTVAAWRSELTGERSKPAPAVAARQPAVASGANGDITARAPGPPLVAGAADNTAHDAMQVAGASDGVRPRASNARAGIVWAAAGAIAAATVTAVLLTRAPDRGAEPKLAVVPPLTMDDKGVKGADGAAPKTTDTEPPKMVIPAAPQSDTPPQPVITPPPPKTTGATGKPPSLGKTALANKVVPPVPQQSVTPAPPEPVTPVPPEPVAVIRPKPDPPLVLSPDKPAQPTPQEKIDEAEKAIASGEFSKVRDMLTAFALRGNTAAQMKLAETYANGRGVARNYTQAYVWYSHAARCGNAAAAAERARVAARLQAPEVEQADKTVASMKVC